VLLSFPGGFGSANVPDRALPIIVARVWPPRKRDFLNLPAPIKHKPY
jgi:hypothetical protein